MTERLQVINQGHAKEGRRAILAALPSMWCAPVCSTVVLAACLIALAGCASPFANAPLIGEPANTPARPETPAAYLPVHDVPPPREQPVLTADEQRKLQQELLAARDRQNAEVNTLSKGSK